MKFWEICKKENRGKKYKDSDGIVFTVKTLGSGTFLVTDETHYDITGLHNSNELMTEEFEEIK